LLRKNKRANTFKKNFSFLKKTELAFTAAFLVFHLPKEKVPEKYLKRLYLLFKNLVLKKELVKNFFFTGVRFLSAIYLLINFNFKALEKKNFLT